MQHQTHSVVGYTVPRRGSNKWSHKGGWKSRGPVAGCTTLQVGVVLVGQGLLCCGLHLLAVLLHLLVVDLHLGGSEGGGGDELLDGC